MVVRYLVNVWSPTLIDVVRKHQGSECCKCHPVEFKWKRGKKGGDSPGTVSPTSHLVRQGTKASQTGFAFSQEPGYGDLIRSGRLSFVDTRHRRSGSVKEQTGDMGRVVVASPSTHSEDSIQPVSPPNRPDSHV